MGYVLLVEDDVDSAEVVTTFLERSGHHVARAPDGKRALALLATARPEVVILDLNVPGLDGIGFLRVLRSCFRDSPPQVIVVSGLPDGPKLRRASELGVRRVFRKADYQLADLLACVNECCEQEPVSWW